MIALAISQSCLYRYCINIVFNYSASFRNEYSAYRKSHESFSCESFEEQSLSIFQENFANPIVSLLNSSMFIRECVRIAEASGIENIQTHS